MVALKNKDEILMDGHKTPTVLLVEDDPDLRAGTEMVLRAANFTIVAAEDGRAALGLLTAGLVTPDLIISDIMMPFMTGYELLEKVREMPRLLGIPFIFLTAYGSDEHIRRAHEGGIDDYLVKPFDPVRLVLIVRNKLRRAVELRRLAEDELAVAREHIVQLLSHEIRGPLTSVVGGLDILEDTVTSSGMVSPDTRFGLEVMRAGIKRLNRLTEQTVRYAEQTNGREAHLVEISAKPYSPEDLLRKALETAQLELQARGAKLMIDYEISAEVMILAVPSLIISALYEVLRNAATFNKIGGQIWIEAKFSSPFVSFSIRDEGCGIAEADLQAIFDPMVQSGRKAQEQQGIGLGLPIAKNSIENHGGSITLTSQLGHGTLVTIYLPTA